MSYYSPRDVSSYWTVVSARGQHGRIAHAIKFPSQLYIMVFAISQFHSVMDASFKYSVVCCSVNGLSVHGHGGDINAGMFSQGLCTYFVDCKFEEASVLYPLDFPR